MYPLCGVFFQTQKLGKIIVQIYYKYMFFLTVNILSKITATCKLHVATNGLWKYYIKIQIKYTVSQDSSTIINISVLP